MYNLWLQCIGPFIMLSPLLNSLLTIQTLCTTFIGAAEIVRAQTGSPVELPCPSVFQPDDNIIFKWTQFGVSDRSCDYQYHKPNLTIQHCESKYNIRGHPPRLYVEQPMSSDSGIYICSITRVIPPPSQESNYTVDLQVFVPPNIVLKKQKRNATCLQLLCSTGGLEPQEVNFTWNQKGQGVLKTILTEKSHSNMNSSLPLCQSERNEGDILTCNVVLFNGIILSKNITIHCSDIETCPGNFTLLVIICVSSLFGVAAIAAVTLIIYKCCHRVNTGDSVSYNNKVYENFSFSTRNYAEKTPSESVRDQCIYEN